MRHLLALFVLVWCWLCLSTGVAKAHAIGLSRGDYVRTADGLEVELVFARGDVLAALPSLDEDHDGSISAGELGRGMTSVTSFVLQGLLVSRDDRLCTGVVSTPELTDDDGLLAHVSFRCGTSSNPLGVQLAFLRAMGHGHRHRAQVSNGTARTEAIYFGEDSRFEVPPFVLTTQIPALPQHSLGKLGFLRLGFEHILSGADHIAFLLALVLGTARALGLLRVVTAFTLGHSLSLALVALGFYAPNTSWVEPAIALSVAYVGFENLRRDPPKQRHFVSFGFGLVHGLGFGGALSEIRLTPNEIPSALALFNIGVELGQLSLIFAAWPLLTWFRKAPWFARRALPACSLALGACGLIWFAVRVA